MHRMLKARGGARICPTRGTKLPNERAATRNLAKGIGLPKGALSARKFFAVFDRYLKIWSLYWRKFGSFGRKFGFWCKENWKLWGFLLNNLPFLWKKSSRSSGRLKFVGVTYFIIRIKALRRHWKISRQIFGFLLTIIWKSGAYIVENMAFYGRKFEKFWIFVRKNWKFWGLYWRICPSCKQNKADRRGDWSLLR